MLTFEEKSLMDQFSNCVYLRSAQPASVNSINRIVEKLSIAIVKYETNSNDLLNKCKLFFVSSIFYCL